jgi:hypothetical protein
MRYIYALILALIASACGSDSITSPSSTGVVTPIEKSQTESIFWGT